MKRFTLLVFVIALLAAAFADDIPDPATLPEKVQKGDMDPEYPAEMARRLREGKTFLENGELEKAGEELAKAEKAALHQMVYFYQAVVAYRLGDYPRALRKAEFGLGVLGDIRAYGDPTPETGEQEKRFVELRDAIQAKLDATGGKAAPDPRKVKQEFEAAQKEANDAFAQGLLAKAAAAYARAYRLDPTQGELGLRAATLYADRLKNLLEAARLWQQVLAAGEPHATSARAELQSHRDALDAVLQAGLAKRDQWRTAGPAEPLQLAEAFPESTDLQVELARVYAFKGQPSDMIKHLQAASRLGLGLDEFRAKRDFINFFEVSGVDTPAGRSLAAFLRDAYGDESVIAAIRTEVKRRADESARLAREKAEKERQARLAAELKPLIAWRQGERSKVVSEINQLVSSRNNTEVRAVYLAAYKPDPKSRLLVYRSSWFSYENGTYLLSSETTTRSIRGNGSENGSVRTLKQSFTSTAAIRDVVVQAGTWVDDYPNAEYQVYEPYRALCRVVDVNFNRGVVRHQTTFRNRDGSDYSGMDTSNQWSARFSVMVTDQEAGRLRECFARLTQLDGAGDNVEKLRQLRR